MLPAILHFQQGAHSGFGLLEALSTPATSASPRFRLWDSQHGSRDVEQVRLVQGWSGVLVLLERGATGVPEQGFVWHRLSEKLLEDWRVRPQLLGAAASTGARLGWGGLLLVLLVLAVSAQPPGPRPFVALLALLCVVGLVASVIALDATHQDGPIPGCRAGGAVDCTSVLRSAWARPLGLPLSGLGTAGFATQLLLLCTTASGGGSGALWLVAASFLPSALVSASLLVLQTHMRRFCGLCLTVHGVNALGAATFLSGPWPEVSAVSIPSALLACLFFGVLLTAALAGPSHRSPPQASTHPPDSALSTLALHLQQPLLNLDGAALGPGLGAPQAPHELVLFVHPSCHACADLPDEVDRLAARHGERLRIHVALAPTRADNPGDDAACTALVAAGVAWGATGMLSLLREAKKDYGRLEKSAAPGSLLAMDSGRGAADLEQALPLAREHVRAALEFQRQHIQSLPALFLDGRRCEAPFPHIAQWLENPAMRQLLSSASMSPPSSRQASA
nr:vitamin K epoxide reductase family protein [Myxococcus fulvus]